MVGLEKLVLTYLGALALCASQAFGAQTVRIHFEKVNVSGDFSQRPLVQNYYWSEESRGELARVWFELIQGQKRRGEFKKKMADSIEGEVQKLRAQHRELMVQGSTDKTATDLESAWSFKMSENIARQAQLNQELEWQMGQWDAEHVVVLKFSWRGKKRVIQEISLPELSKTRKSADIAFLK